MFDIDTPIKNIIYDNIQDSNELDIVFDFQYKKFLQLQNGFKKYVLINSLTSKEDIIL